MKLGRRFFLVCLFLMSGFLLLTALPLGIWLLFNFFTIQGFLLAILGIIGPPLGMWFIFGRRDSRLTTAWGGLIGLIVITLFILTPNGTATESDPLRHLYSNGGQFVRFSPFNIIPEIEQMNVGINLLGPLDPLISKEKADRLAEITLAIYDEARQDKSFRQVGSVMGVPLRPPLATPSDNGHIYLYIPRKIDPSKPVPALVFLHGAGGPFKAYQWVWHDFAEENGFVIISPTYGFGVWTEKESPTIVMRAIDHVAQEASIQLDRDNIWLAGLSNGGYGAVYTATQHPDQFEGVILISPGLPRHLMNNENAPFNFAWRDRPVLVLHGEQDLRMPMGYMNPHLEFMKAGQIDIETILYPSEDHFLFFSQRERLMQQIAEWIQSAADEP